MEKEVELVHKMNRELGGIAEKIVSLAEKIEENHQVHIENRDIILEIKETTAATDVKVGIQNGRVTKSEIKIEEVVKLTAELAKVVSRLDGELMRRINREEAWSTFKRITGQGVISKIIFIIVTFVAYSILEYLFPNLSIEGIIKLIS